MHSSHDCILWQNTEIVIWLLFFQHENQHYPPSLSDYGKLRFAKKSDLLHILAQESQQDPPNSFDAKAYDGAALVHLLPTNQTRLPHLMSMQAMSFCPT